MVLQLIFIQVITFAVIVGILNFLFGSQLKIALNRLQVLHQESLEKEEILNKELERAKVQVQSEIARAKEEAKVIVDAARRNAEKIALSAAEDVEVRVKKSIGEATEKARRLEAEIVASAEDRAVSLAEDVIRYTFSTKGQEILHAQLTGELLEELKKVDKAKLPAHEARAEIITPSPLSVAEENRLKEILADKLGHPVSLDEKIDEALIVGMVIKLGGLALDGSLRNKLARAMNALRAERR
jgi:F0F1-type ATP synthase delta subunit